MHKEEVLFSITNGQWWAIVDKDGRMTEPRVQPIDLDADLIWDELNPETAPHTVMRVSFILHRAS